MLGVILQDIVLKLESLVATMDIVVAGGYKVKGLRHQIFCFKDFLLLTKTTTLAPQNQ